VNFPPDTDVQLYRNVSAPGGGAYSVTIHRDPDNTWNVQKKFTIESVGEFGGAKRRVLERVSMTSYALFAYWTDSEVGKNWLGDPEPLWFLDGDRIEGPVHSNGKFHIHGSPEFEGRVTSASDTMIAFPAWVVNDPGDFPVGDNNPVFLEGFQLGGKKMPFPTSTENLRDVSRATGWDATPATLGSKVEIQLGKRADGSDDGAFLRYREWTYSGQAQAWNEKALIAIPAQVIHSESDVDLWGKLDGELTISSAKNINIVDDLTYAGSSPEGVPPPTCNDLLGLVAGKNIVFADYNDKFRGNIVYDTDNLKVNAVMMALDTSIKAQGEDSQYGTKRLRGELTIYGGLIQKYRGFVGRHDADGDIVSGYVKDYHYDTRVTARTPPHFPLPGTYTVESWQETWDDVAF
jgi:hypothetical protein